MSRFHRGPGVYQLGFRGTAKVYIGASINLNSRYYGQKSTLKAGRHPVQELQQLWDTLGEPHLTFRVLEYVDDILTLADREYRWMMLVDQSLLLNKSRRPIRQWTIRHDPVRLTAWFEDYKRKIRDGLTPSP